MNWMCSRFFWISSRVDVRCGLKNLNCVAFEWKSIRENRSPKQIKRLDQTLSHQILVTEPYCPRIKAESASFWFWRIPDRTLGRHLNHVHSIAYRCSRLHFLNKQWFIMRSSCLIRQGKNVIYLSIMPRFTKSIKIRAYVLKVFLSCRF